MAPSITPLLLGVDTGGTYTDAALLDAADRTVVASAKALTTRHDLAVGVSNALAAISSELDPSRVELVAISTTLATNAVVEGHGSPVLVLLVGFDDEMVARSGISAAFGDVAIEQLPGGHDHHGVERARLDLERAEALLYEHRGTVGAVAIASTFAVRNPSHELALRDLVLRSTELPVTTSSSLSDALDAPRRALTTVLNARLLSRITGLVAAVRRSLEAISIDAPLMITKGDGSLAAADAVVRRPIETILSGPAASVVGAAELSQLDDFVLCDIGGTTTDVGQLIGGRPRLASDGAMVGGWRTMVRAIDVRTSGLGGDSETGGDVRAVRVGPRRRIPIALLGAEHPAVVDALVADLTDPPPRELAAGFVLRLDDGTNWHPLTATEERVLARVGAEPRRLAEVAPGSIERKALGRLSDRSIVQVGGFTPSDAAHVLGLQDNWSTPAARAAAELLAHYGGSTAEELAHAIWSEMVRRSAGCVLEVAFDDVLGDPLRNEIVNAAASGQATLQRVDVRVTPRDPIVAVGGPAAVYYRGVAERLDADLVVPVDHDVANAVGAAAGRLVARASAEVYTDGPGRFRVVSATGVETATSGESALAVARERATELATSQLAELSAGLPAPGVPELLVDVERHDDPRATDDDGIYTAVCRVELNARPVAAS